MNLIKSSFIVAISLLVTACGVSKKIDTIQHTQLPQVTAADEMSARLRLLSIGQAESQYAAVSDGNYASMDDLIQKGYLTDPNKGQLTRYMFDVELKPNGFSATAVPQKYPMTGRQSFYIDESNVLRGADKGGAKATVDDPPM